MNKASPSPFFTLIADIGDKTTMSKEDRERPIRHLQGLYTVVVGIALTVALTKLIDQ